MKLSLLLEQSMQEDAERDVMLAQMVKNPDTGQDITVKTALGYDKGHPARKAAAKIYAQYMAKKSGGQPSVSTPQKSFQPKPSYRPQRRVQQDPWDAKYGDDAYDAYRDYQATGDSNIVPKNQDRARDDWGRPMRYPRYNRRRF